ncbi:MAG TPA: ABC transporter permease [Candidatus Dormibacteraeota bacterium]|nr:ABC transporter permease [Candidatus Dormibacteraeota bacterium]
MNSRLTFPDLFRVGSLGLRSRRLRALLSALGVSIGIAAIVGVLGISASSQARLLAQLDALGTNLLTVAPGQALGGSQAYLPQAAPGMIRRVGPVLTVSGTGLVPNAQVFRTDKIPRVESGGISVRAADVNLLQTLGATLQHGTFLNPATAQYPAVVLGASAAQYLGISDAEYPIQVYLGGQWFTVIGILQPVALAPTLDRSALVGYPAAQRYLHFDGEYTTVYLRTDPNQVADVQAVLARTANPNHPEEVAVSRPSDVLAARVAAQGAYTSLFIGLGAVALLVGGVAIANTMLTAVLERRSEIGLRRALGATETHVGLQFLTESLLLSGMGGLAGVLLGSLATTVYALSNHWIVVVPLLAVWSGMASALLVGGVAGLYPATRAARLTPTEALRTV